MYGNLWRLDWGTPLTFRYSVMGSECAIYSKYLESSHSFLEAKRSKFGSVDCTMTFFILPSDCWVFFMIDFLVRTELGRILLYLVISFLWITILFNIKASSISNFFSLKIFFLFKYFFLLFQMVIFLTKYNFPLFILIIMFHWLTMAFATQCLATIALLHL